MLSLSRVFQRSFSSPGGLSRDLVGPSAVLQRSWWFSWSQDCFEMVQNSLSAVFQQSSRIKVFQRSFNSPSVVFRVSFKGLVGLSRDFRRSFNFVVVRNLVHSFRVLGQSFSCLTAVLQLSFSCLTAVFQVLQGSCSKTCLKSFSGLSRVLQRHSTERANFTDLEDC